MWLAFINALTVLSGLVVPCSWMRHILYSFLSAAVQWELLLRETAAVLDEFMIVTRSPMHGCKANLNFTAINNESGGKIILQSFTNYRICIIQFSCSGWPTGNRKKLSSSQTQLSRQHAWLLLKFFPFPVGHPEHEHCKYGDNTNRDHFFSVEIPRIATTLSSIKRTKIAPTCAFRGLGMKGWRQHRQRRSWTPGQTSDYYFEALYRR